MIIYAPFESPNRVDSKYVVLKNVCIDFLAKICEKPIHIRTIYKSGFILIYYTFILTCFLALLLPSVKILFDLC
jgi:hypothetical protein